MAKTWIFLLCLQCLLASGLANVERSIDNFVNQISSCMSNPAISVAALSLNDKGVDTVKYYKGFNRVTLADNIEASHATRFCIGGATQAFTAVLLAKLLEQTNYTWDTPIQEILSRQLGFQEKYRSENLNLKDIFLMRSGLAGMEIVPIAKPFRDADHLTSYLRYAPEVSSFRDSYVTNEVLFAYVEEVLQKLGNDTWANLVESLILKPLRMEDTVTVADAEKFSSNELAPGAVLRSANNFIYLSAKSLSGLELVAPAAGLCTSARDMVNWFKFLLSNRNVPVNKETLQTTLNTLAFRNTPQVNLRHQDMTNEHTDFQKDPTFTYNRDKQALGWVAGQYRGYAFVSQDGSLAGYQTLATIIPSKKVAVFTSFAGDESDKNFIIKTIINQYILDILLEERSSWLTRGFPHLCSIVENIASKLSTRRTPGRSVYGAQAIYQPEVYENRYWNYAFGEVHVKQNSTLEQNQGKKLYLTYGQITFDLTPTSENHTFLMRATGNYWHITNTEFYTKYRILTARFHAFTWSEQDGERAQSVTIQGFDKNVDGVEFSVNPERPKFSMEQCSGATLPQVVIFSWLVALTALVSYIR
ncbi:gigasin-6 [Biomphalaria glabrata]|nr:gigasin-6 [Biomphalaria glabrata]